jgi:hypothetical protein
MRLDRAFLIAFNLLARLFGESRHSVIYAHKYTRREWEREREERYTDLLTAAS